jgi:tRNA(fMet)-specific endonuclease VapC
VVDEFASLLEVLPYSAKASEHYGAIRAALERTGRPVGVIDLHIAADARSEGLTLVTNNLAEFERVPRLLTENSVDAAG